MGILDAFRSKKVDVKPKRGRSYSGAATGRLFSSSFGASERSADSELQSALPKLRSRSRDLVRNNEYAKRYMKLLRNNVVGKKGFNTQVRAFGGDSKLDQAANQLIESKFSRWCRLGNCTVDGKLSWIDVQKLAIETLARDGEAFIIKHRGAGFHDSFALEFVESDQVDTTFNRKAKGGNEIRMGVEVNPFKKPIAYYFLQAHPGDANFSTMTVKEKYNRVPASKVIHLLETNRVGQTRGEPWLTSSMAAMNQLGALREAAIVNARIGASKMGFFTSAGGDGFVPDDMAEDIPIMEVEPGTMHQLPVGVDFKSFDPQYPNNEFDGFHKAVLKGVAVGLGPSYPSLSGDLEGVSYSSIRQGALDERDYYENLQELMVTHLIRPIFEEWLGSAMEMGKIGIPLARFDHFAEAAQFRGRAWSWVDPLKEMNAAVTGLKNGVLSLDDVASQYGKDVEELLGQIARDKSLAAQFGVKYAIEPFGGNLEKIAPDITDDD